MSIAVVYQNWIPAGSEPIDRFMASYVKFLAGCQHDLIILNRESGTDISAYIEAATNFHYDCCLFLNAYSEILCHEWLAKLFVFGAGLVGATGSYETMDLPGWPKGKNPHIRSNAFLIKRDLLLSIAATANYGRDKKECYDFESGPNSLTKRVIGKGLSVLVAGRDGRLYRESDWMESQTFRFCEQGNLIVADNHTRAYQEADATERGRLTRLAWGE